MIPLNRSSLTTAVALAALVVSGCGSSTVRVTGRLLKGDKPLIPSEGQAVGLTFYPMETIKDSSGRVLAPGGEPFPAAVDPETGTFDVPGPDGRGLPLGKYRVAVSLRQRTAPPNSSGKKVKRDEDLLRDQFNEKSSPIVREITAKSDLTIDLDKPTG